MSSVWAIPWFSIALNTLNSVSESVDATDWFFFCHLVGFNALIDHGLEFRLDGKPAFGLFKYRGKLSCFNLAHVGDVLKFEWVRHFVNYKYVSTHQVRIAKSQSFVGDDDYTMAPAPESAIDRVNGFSRGVLAVNNFWIDSNFPHVIQDVVAKVNGRKSDDYLLAGCHVVFQLFDECLCFSSARGGNCRVNNIGHTEFMKLV